MPRRVGSTHDARPVHRRRPERLHRAAGRWASKGATRWRRASRTTSQSTHADDYALIVASRDWHHGDDDNGGHFSDAPDFVDTWPVHASAGPSAPITTRSSIPLASPITSRRAGRTRLFAVRGITDDGETAAHLLESHGIRDIDVVGIATDYCVRASALDALGAGRRVRVLTDLVAGCTPTRAPPP